MGRLVAAIGMPRFTCVRTAVAKALISFDDNDMPRECGLLNTENQLRGDPHE